MTRKRTVVKLSDMVKAANAFMLNSKDELAGNREGVASLVMKMLSDAGNYHGFGYLTEGDMKHSEFGKSVGIIRGEVGKEPNVYPDESRKFFFLQP